ncbi:helix-turn-helix domain-containing protein [Anaerovibrio lipolyticus]|uniref:helix-turn-helix domain-containing protein n=1 Tax=Anaerovibrio lipolyticus TaxID=82374 RepID=UPI00055D0D05|nr:helix-turn-helix transcriptional regulator [Anaerovibrio lipolyticus]
MDITASRLRELRKIKQLSQEDVAKYLGITRTAYNKYESGDIKPVRKLNELAVLFNVSVDYLLGREESTLESKVREVSPHISGQLRKYLDLSESGKDIVDITLNAVYEQENH